MRQLILDADSKTLQNLQVRRALRILFIGASPEGLPNLKIEETATELQKLLEEPIKKKQIVFNVLLNATLKELQQELVKDYHILYFAGHGSPEGIFLDDGEGDPVENQLLRRNPGDFYRVSAKELAQALEGKPTRLIFLATCNTSAAPDESGLLAGFAQELAKQSKLPAIVAMQYFISDRQANDLTTQFFVGLATSRPVDVALAEARKVLIRRGQVGRDVFAPVLYLQAEDGALFQKPQNWPVISLGVALALAMFIGEAIARSREISEINRFMGLAEQRLASNQTLDARIESLRAAKKLKHSFWQRIFPDAGLKIQMLANLSATIYAVSEIERFQQTLEDPTAPVKNVISPNGKFQATIQNNNVVVLENIFSKKSVVIQGYSDGVKSVGFRDDSKTLFTIGNDGNGRVWDTNFDKSFKFIVDKSNLLTDKQVSAMEKPGASQFCKNIKQ